MLKGFISGWNERRKAKAAVAAIDEHAVLGPVRELMVQIINSPDEFWATANENAKGLLITRIIEGVSTALSNPDPRSALRNLLANYVIDCANFAALLADDVKPHLPELVSKDDSLKTLVYAEASNPASASEMADLIYVSFHQRNAWLRACNVARMML